MEDSKTQQRHLALLLERGGFRVSAAGNGAEALSLLAERQPALVISDVMMPEMDGYELCRRIKEDPALSGIPVILVTFLSEPLDVVRGLEAGADNFVMKPYEADFLLSRIRRTLSASQKKDPCALPECPLEMDGKEYQIRSDRRQALEILLSTYETALLKNERLKAAQEELRKANEELEAFNYSVSHDLRVPLTVILGFAEFLLLDYRDSLDANGQKHLSMIRQAAEKMNRLIEDLLNLSRAGRAEIRRERVDLSAMARDIAAELRKTDGARDVDIVVHEGMETTGDVSLLRIALENLLRNAWKFTSKREDARIEAGFEPGRERVFFVRDNGAGFDMKDSDKLFASFRRLHSDTEFPGTGLGLTIVHRIITRLGGRIWAEGRVGEGATFYFTLSQP